MAPTKCRKCKVAHGPPKHKNCQRGTPDPLAGLTEEDFALPPEFFQAQHRRPAPTPAPQQPAPAAAAPAAPTVQEQLASIAKSIDSLTDKVQQIETEQRQQAVREAGRQVGYQPSPTPSHAGEPAGAADRAGGEGGFARRVRAELRRAEETMSDTFSEDSESDAGRRRTKKKKACKSGRYRTANRKAKKELDWPHHRVYKGADRKPAEYDDLSPVEFVLGYLLLTDELPRGDVFDRQLRHLIDLMYDACSFPWHQVRGFHGLVLHEMEMRYLKWDDEERIQRLRRQYSQAQGFTCAGRAGTGGSVGRTKGTDIDIEGIDPDDLRYCGLYQRGKCEHAGHHYDRQGKVAAHVCAFCLRRKAVKAKHTADSCRTQAQKEKEKNDRAEG